MTTGRGGAVGQSVLLAAMLVTAVACGGPLAGVALVEHQSVALNVLADGSVEVRESLRVRFLATPVSTFRRHLSGQWSDGYIDVRASLDGQPLDAGTSPARVVIDRVDALEASWEFPPTSDAVREFVLEYRVAGAMSRHGANGLLNWQVLPLSPSYPVVRADVTLSVPPGAIHLAPPFVEASVPWQTSVDGTMLSATRAGIAPDERASVHARLAADTLSLAVPEWQFDAERAAELVPAFASGGLFMIVVGLGVVWMLAAQFPDPRKGMASADAVDEKADDGRAGAGALPGGFAPTLRHRRRVEVRPSMVTTLDGMVAHGMPGSPGDGTLAGGAAGRPEHQRLLGDELWLQQVPVEQAMAALASPSRSLRRRFASALQRDLVVAGLVDPERLATASGLRLSGVVIMGLGLGCAAVVAWLLPRYGSWAHAVPAGIVGLGAILLVAGLRFTILTTAGERAARALRK